jgi:ABC-type dipeptide/oligopeptide/nickel transport system permease subunit
LTEPRPPLIEGSASFGSPAFPSHGPEGGEVQVIASGWRLALREFFANKLAVLGLAVIVLFFLFCFIGPLIYPTNQSLVNPLVTDLPPGGTTCSAPTSNGFDELGRIMLGGQSALEIGFFASRSRR